MMSGTVNWEDLKEALQSAHFDKAETIVRDIDWAPVIRLAVDADDTEAVTAVSMSAELLDYLGQHDVAAERISELAARVVPALERLQAEQVGAPRTTEDRKRLKSRIWVLFHQGMAHYRRQEYDRARELFAMGEALCLRWLENRAEYSSRGTLARLNYGLGLVDREQYAYRRAQHHFLASVTSAWPHVRTGQHSQSKPEQTRWTDLAVARATALGLAYIYCDLGQPLLALPLLLLARINLARLQDRYMRHMVDIIYYNTIRSAYGDDPERLDEAIDGLRTCYLELQGSRDQEGHNLYAMRAAHSLAQALVQRVPDRSFGHVRNRDLDEAEAYCSDADIRAVKLHDTKIRLLLLICQSRIERKRSHFVRAEELARNALARGADQYPHIRVRALIVHAEALMHLGRNDDALRDLTQCDRDDADVSNPRLRAMALLRQAEIHANMKQSNLAEEFLAKYHEIADGITDAQTRELGSHVRKEIQGVKEGQDFIVRLADEGIDRERLECEFHRFLAKWARVRSRTDKEAADKLDVSRQTLSNWASWKNPLELSSEELPPIEKRVSSTVSTKRGTSSPKSRRSKQAAARKGK
jgi:hypothetical protein